MNSKNPQNKILTPSHIAMSVAIVIAFLVTAVLRAPDVLIAGRFWAEEGTVFWAHTHQTSLIDHLLFIPKWYGYIPFYYEHPNGTRYLVSALRSAISNKLDISANYSSNTHFGTSTAF